MASTDTVGEVTQLDLITTTAQSETVITKITSNFIAVNSDATYGLIDTGQKALASLLDDAYSDSTLTTSISILRDIDFD